MVKVKWSKIKSEGKRDYERCYGSPFLLQLSGSGLVAPCGCLFNEKYSKYHIGNIVDTSFKEIVFSDRYRDVMNELASPRFNAKTMCGTLCVQHKVNEALDMYKKGVVKLDKPAGEPPKHINFI
jgi:sulfatase maturation enzyme AslB (radical SAM superfamily)